MTNIGHNSGATNTATTLKSYIEGIENYEAEKKEIIDSLLINK